jgi:integrase
LDKKYKNAEKELVWQFFFPAKILTLIPDTQEYRRYHLHETHVRKAIRRAVKKNKIPKRATAHTFRHPAKAGPVIYSRPIMIFGPYRNY